MRAVRMTAALAAILIFAPAVPAAQDAAAPMTERAERIGLEGRRGPSLFRPGYAVGEYTGASSARSSSVRLFGSRDLARAEFTVAAPGLPAPVEATCAGGQSHRNILGITFDREELGYECAFAGGAPAGARLGLALARGSLLARLQQPQRAAEMVWGPVTLRAETRRIGGLPIGGGRTMGYVISKDGVEVGGVDINGLRPTFYLPPQGSPDRDAVAVFALSLFFFPDPANR